MRKQSLYFSCLLALVACALHLTSCNEVDPLMEEMEVVDENQPMGKSIVFSAAIRDNNPGTKTVYGDIVDGRQEIRWLSGDKIRIVKMLGGQSSYCDYGVTVSYEDYTTAEIHPLGDGLYWGTGEHAFYAVYPTPLRNSNVSFSEGNVINLAFDSVQSGDFDMNSAYMFAGAVSNPADAISLEFKPLFSAFQVSLHGERNMHIDKIVLSSASKALCGSYQATITPNSNSASSTVVYSFPSRTSENSSITINFPSPTVLPTPLSYNKPEQQHPNDPFTVVFFALPRVYDDLVITLYTSDGERVIDLTKNQEISFDKEIKFNLSYTAPALVVPDNAIRGVFSVSADKSVYFSKALLTGRQNGTGEFQYFYINATQTSKVGAVNANTNIGQAPAEGNSYGSLDLFGWSTSNNNYGLTSSIDPGSFAGVFREWGTENNPIRVSLGSSTLINPSETDPHPHWYTLSAEEWSYLLGIGGGASRSSATLNGVPNAHYAKITYAGTPGLLIFPDNYVHPSGASLVKAASINNPSSPFSANSFTSTYANQKMFSSALNQGAVFIPLAGQRVGNEVTGVNEILAVWTSTADGDDKAKALYCTDDVLEIRSVDRHVGQAVRLVREVD